MVYFRVFIYLSCAYENPYYPFYFKPLSECFGTA